MSFLTNLEWRYAAKKFDTTKKVSSDDLSTILEAIRLTPTSYGVQPYHFYVITNQEVKDKIQAASWNQAQIGTSSHLLVFVARTDLEDVKEEFFTMMSGGKAEIRTALAGYEGMVDGMIVGLNAKNSVLDWAARQTYISLGFALAAAAELEIDSCPMEGFDPAAVAEILGAPANQKVLALLPIGYRGEVDAPRPGAKVRFSKEALFTEVK